MTAAEVLGMLASQKEPFSHSDMSTIYSKSQWKFKITVELTFMDNIKAWKKHCETHDWLLASHMKMLFLLGPFPTRRDVYPPFFGPEIPESALNWGYTSVSDQHRGDIQGQKTFLGRKNWRRSQRGNERYFRWFDYSDVWNKSMGVPQMVGWYWKNL